MATASPPIRVTIVTLDSHLATTVQIAQKMLRKDIPGLQLSLHAAAEWSDDDKALQACHDEIAAADIIIVSMLFLEDHIQAMLPALEARRDACDAMVCLMSAGEIIKLNKLGGFSMRGESKGPMAMLKRLRGTKGSGKGNASSGAGQMAMLRRLPKILRFIPGTAQDVRAYFLCMQYWLAGSDENIAAMVAFMVNRYADGERRSIRGSLKPPLPAEYPDTGLYHPQLANRVTEYLDQLPQAHDGKQGTVGVLVMRAYVLANDSSHYDAVIAALEARGLRVITAFASGLDARPAIEKYFMRNGQPVIDAMLSLTGFSLVGGPAYNDARAAEDMLARLDVPYIAAHPLEFQNLQQWRGGERGLMPVEATMMVAIPELDGAVAPAMYGGRTQGEGAVCEGCEQRCKFGADSERKMHPCPERIDALTGKLARMIRLRQRERAERKLAIVLFNFPPNAGNTGTAAYLDVFASLFNTLKTLAAAGYDVAVPDSLDELQQRLLHGNAEQYGTDANVHALIPVDDHVRREKHLHAIESQWGAAPGRQLSDGHSIQVLGAQFGNVLVGIQPGFGYEGDPMRLLFEKGFAPTHAFAAFYRYLNEDFAADAVLHFGTHGALEFMPGKQSAMSSACWPERLIGDLPNFYLYAANNPSEGIIAKRRAGATLISYMTPPVSHAGLYAGLQELKASLDSWRKLSPAQQASNSELAELIQAQAHAVDLAAAEPLWESAAVATEIQRLQLQLHELEQTLIPHGLHEVGREPDEHERREYLLAISESLQHELPEAALTALLEGMSVEQLQQAHAADDEDLADWLKRLADINSKMGADNELNALLHALDGGYIHPAPGGDLLRTPEILPTGRNIHGFDPFRLPSTYSVQQGARQAERLLARHRQHNEAMPEGIAMVLWGTDNLKSEGTPIAEALALIGARPRMDSYGRICGAELIPLAELGRPRIDVTITLSGIFRDLLPLQTRMLAEAAYLAAAADEPIEQNFIRKHALAYQQSHDCDLETAALRVFSNADGVYGSNVNRMVDSGCWEDEDELANAYSKRKCFAYGMSGKPVAREELLTSLLADVELAYQNLDSVELGVTSIDHYFDTLGGIGRAVKRARGSDAPVYIGDQTGAEGKVRTLSEQVALETRTRVLNPNFYEAMLKHGHQGVSEIEHHITNTMGWSATTGQVSPWVYKRMTQTFMLDETMRERLASLNPAASAKLANRLLEAHERNYWQPDEDMLAALRKAGEDLEDRLEGITTEVIAA